MAANAIARRNAQSYCESKSTSNCANQHARKPRQFILSAPKDGVVGVRMFPAAFGSNLALSVGAIYGSDKPVNLAISFATVWDV